MQVVVLAGGRGRRLHPLTGRRPKPMLPVLGRPLLGQLLAHLGRQPIVDEIIVATGYLGDVIDAYIDGHVGDLDLPVPVRAVREPAPRGTAGAVAALLPALRAPFAVVSAGMVTDLDLAAMAEAHARLRAVATICVMPPSARTRFGLVEAPAGRVTTFLERPTLQRLQPSALVNGGSYILEPRALDRWGSGAVLDFDHDVLPRLVEEGQVVGTASAARFWMDVGTADGYRHAHFDALAGRWPWPVPASDEPVLVSSPIDVTGPVHFGRNVVIGPHVRLVGPLSIGSDVMIGPDAEVTRSVLLDGSSIGAGSWVHEAVIDEGMVLPRASAAAGGVVGYAAGPEAVLVRSAGASGELVGASGRVPAGRRP